MYACFEAIEFFGHFLPRYVSRIRVLKPTLSQKVDVERPIATTTVVLGGSNHNERARALVAHLHSLGLPWRFHRERADRDNHSIVNVHGGNDIFNSTYGEGANGDNTHESYRTFTDFALIVRCPHPDDRNSTVLWLAGTHGSGTRAALRAVLDPGFCYRIVKEVRDQPFAAIVRVDIENLRHSQPILVRSFVLSSIASITPKEDPKPLLSVAGKEEARPP
jgi:hypothetical protein